MRQARFFVDTAYVSALLNPRDAYHKKAKELLSQLRTAHEVWITEAVLIEAGLNDSKAGRTTHVEHVREKFGLPK